jgi:sugar-specific transcriptional regulator TrmB
MEQAQAAQILKDMGFSEWEVETYLALLKHGPQTAVELARLTHVARSKTYEVVTRLRRKGYVMKVPPMPTSGVTQRFVAMDPKKVFSSKQKEIEEAGRYLGKLYENPIKPRFPNINYYTSREAAKELFSHLHTTPGPFYIRLVNLDLKIPLGYAFDHFFREIQKKKHHFLLEETKELAAFSKSVKHKSFFGHGGINYIITSDSVILDLWQSQHVILEINSKEAVTTYLQLFKEAMQ